MKLVCFLNNNNYDGDGDDDDDDDYKRARVAGRSLLFL